MDSPLIFYLRDEPLPFGPRKPKLERKRKQPLAEMKIGPPQGRPVVSIAAVEVPAPEPIDWEDRFWVHFCVASCGPVDLGDVDYRAPDRGFAKEFGRQVALDRLAKRRTMATQSKKDRRGELLTFHNRVGQAIPIYSDRLTNPTSYRRLLIKRAIIEVIAGTNDFSPAARTLAKRWLRSEPKPSSPAQADQANGTSAGAELTEELLVSLAEEAEKGYPVDRLRQRQMTEA